MEERPLIVVIILQLSAIWFLINYVLLRSLLALVHNFCLVLLLAIHWQFKAAFLN